MIQSLLLQDAILFSHKFVLEDWRCEKGRKIPLKHGLVGQETWTRRICLWDALNQRFIGNCRSYTRLCPQSMDLNYTNPESIVSEAVRRKYPNVK